MPKLHLVGVTADLKGLVFSHRARAKTGDLVVEVTDDLLQAIDEVRRLDARSRHPALNSPALPSRRDASSNGGSSLGLREIQHRLRTGESVAEVAARAGVTAAWVERFAAPIRAEQGRIVQLAWRLTASKARLGPSSAPLGLSVASNVLDRGVTLSREEMDAAWRAFQVVDGVWTIRFGYTSRGRSQAAEWELVEEPPAITSRNKLASDLGHLEGEPAALAVALLAAMPAKSRGRSGGQPVVRADEEPLVLTLPVVEVTPDIERQPRASVAPQASRETPPRAEGEVAAATAVSPAHAAPSDSTAVMAVTRDDVPETAPAVPKPTPATKGEPSQKTLSVAPPAATNAVPVGKAAPVPDAAAGRKKTRVAGRRVTEAAEGPADHRPEAAERRPRRPARAVPTEQAPTPPRRGGPSPRLRRVPEAWRRDGEQPRQARPAGKAAGDEARASEARAAEAGSVGSGRVGSGGARSPRQREAPSDRSVPRVAGRAVSQPAAPARKRAGQVRAAPDVDDAAASRRASRSAREAGDAPLGSWSPPVQGPRSSRRR